jgi:inosine-uridine nucleoside N-ribohydrolase
MSQKVILVADPGIDTAVAIALALNDPELEVLALVATAGNVSADRATKNAHIIVEQIDPPRWPRLGSALPIEYDGASTDLNGGDGLGGLDFPCVQLHHSHPSDKLIADTLRQYPGEVAILVLGPCTVLARALDRDPELARLIQRLVIVGGAVTEPGDVTPVAEFHFWCDPASARQVLRCSVPITLLPLDVTHKFIFSPGDCGKLGSAGTRTGDFLGKILPTLLSPTASRFGIEGVYLNDALAVVALARSVAVAANGAAVDVETRGELTRGMSVVDRRWGTAARPMVDLASDIDLRVARQYIQGILASPLA